MTSLHRAVVAALALCGATALLAGCASGPGDDAPTSGSAPQSTVSAAPTTPGDPVTDDVEVAWLDGGRGFAVVTWGSSTCVPTVDTVDADGQNLTVTMAQSQEKACTDDLVPRATYAAVPEGVDVTKDIEITVVSGQRSEDVDLSALAEAPTEPSDQSASAGWFEHGGIALLTWGSSTCLPVVTDVAQEDASATITFQDVDGVCTRDLVPRVTAILLDDPVDDDAPFQLTLTGGGLDGTVTVMN